MPIATVIFFLGIAIAIFGGAPENLCALAIGGVCVIAAFALHGPLAPPHPPIRRDPCDRERQREGER